MVGVYEYLIVVLICNSLVCNDVKHLSVSHEDIPFYDMPIQDTCLFLKLCTLFVN